MTESNAKEASVNKQAVKGDTLASTAASVLVSSEKRTTNWSLVSFSSSSPNAEIYPQSSAAPMMLSKYSFINSNIYSTADLQLMNEPIVSFMLPCSLIHIVMEISQGSHHYLFFAFSIFFFLYFLTEEGIRSNKISMSHSVPFLYGSKWCTHH